VRASGQTPHHTRDPDRSECATWRHCWPRTTRAATAWLARKLEACDDGGALCRLVRDRGGLRGITVESPKGERQAQALDHLGGAAGRAAPPGAALLNTCRGDWLDSGLDSVWVTARRVGARRGDRLGGIARLHVVSVEPDRYGPGRDESIFVWTPDRDPLHDLAGMVPLSQPLPPVTRPAFAT